MRYVEYLPSPRLARVVERFWLLEGLATGAPDAVIPDGRMELIFHYRGAFWRHGAGCALSEGEGPAPLRQPRSLLVGQMMGPTMLAPEGDVGVAAIRLRPAAPRTLLGFSMRDAADRFIDLSSIFPSVTRLQEQLAEARDDRGRITALERWILDSVREASPRIEVEAAVRAIVATDGRATVDALADLTGLGLRQLERQFHDAVGLAPKTFSRIIRLQAALHLIRDGRALSDVALACGFYDQAHMTRDFRQLASMSPGAWQSHAGELAGLFVA